MSYYDQMIDLQNATPGNTAVLKLSYNATFDKLHLKLGGTLAKTDIGTITGKANGVTFFEDDAANLALLDAYNGVFTQSDTITIDFTEPNTRGGAAAQYLASIPRNLLKSLTFEIQIKSTAPSGMTLKAEGEYRDPTTNPFILRRKKFTMPLGFVGDNDMALMSGPQGGIIKRVRVQHGGNVTAAELRTNGTPRIRASVASLTYAEKRNRLTPQTNWLMLDFIADGNLMGMLDTTKATETLLRLTTSAADSATIYVDYVADLRALN
jgi:hypothetical protein